MTAIEEIIKHHLWPITNEKWALKTTIVSMGIDVLLERGPLKGSTNSDNYSPATVKVRKEYYNSAFWILSSYLKETIRILLCIQSFRNYFTHKEFSLAISP